MKTPALKSRFGFTLVELMVVVSVIGILSAVVYASFGDSRKIARDQIRKTDLKNLQVAIELYKAQNGRYPARCPNITTTEYWSGNPKSGGTFSCTPGTDFIIGLVPDYIAALPVDPGPAVGLNTGYMYKTDANGTGYKLIALNTVETQFITSYSDEFARCSAVSAPACPATLSGTVRKSYAVYKGASAEGW